MRQFKKTVSLLLSVMLIVSVFTIVPATPASAETVQAFARKWVKAVNVTGDYFSFADLYSNFIICRGSPNFDETNFNVDDTSNVFNRTGDISLDSDNEIRLDAWDDGNNHLHFYTSANNSAQGDGKLYLSTNGDHINFNTDGVTWYAYTWETFTVEYVAAQAPYYDSTDEFGYVNGHKEHYGSGDRKFVAIDGTTDGHQNVRQVEEEELAVPYFEFELYGDSVYKLKKCNNTGDTVIYIPDTIPANYPVQTYRGSNISVIAGGAFKDHTNLVTVHIGDKVNLIGADQLSQGTVPLETLGAFDGCTNLREVYIGETDASAFNRADDFCFEGCTSLEYIEATTKKDDHNDYYGGISEIASNIAESGELLTVRCYHDSSLANWFANNNKVELEYHETTTPIHTFIANSDCIKWTWSGSGSDVSAKVALKCSVCELRTEVEAELQPVPDSHPASCNDPVEGHYMAVAHFDGQEFTDHGYTYKCTIPGKAHTPMTEGTYANLYKLDTSSGFDYELRRQFKCSVCNSEYTGNPFWVEYHSRTNSSCTKDGNDDYCTAQNNYYRSLGNNDLYEKVDSAADVIIPASHTLVEHAYEAPSCTTEGKQQYWECTVCNKRFSDAAGTTEITNVSIPVSGHTLAHHPKTDATETTEGNLEYWQCTVCGKYFSDANGEHETAREYTVIPVCDMESPLEYIDDKGNSAAVYNAHKIKSTSTRINGAAGSFAVAPGETVTIDGVCSWTGNIDLILCDGATLNITKGINIENGTLNIYGQSEQTGTLNISGNSERRALYVRGNIGIHGGVINATNSVMDSIYSLGSIRINNGAVSTDKRLYSGDALGIYGGKITVNEELHGFNTVTIYLTDPSDSLYAGNYGTRYSNPENCGTITVRSRVFNGEKFIEADTEYNAGNCGDLNGKTLLVRNEHEHMPLLHCEECLATANTNGYIEHWRCTTCSPNKYFTDPYGAVEVSESDITLYAGQGVAFVDTDGVVRYAYNATKLTASSYRLPNSGWYYAEGNVTIDSGCYWAEDVKLILCDGAALTVNFTPTDYDQVAVDIYGSLTVYGQTGGTGTFNVNVVDPNHENGRTWALEANGVTVNGGNVNVYTEGRDGCLAISCHSNDPIIINRGNVKATAGCDTYDDGVESGAYAIKAYDVTVYGGSLEVDASGAYGMFVYTKFSFWGGSFKTSKKTVAEQGVILSWKNASDSFRSNGFDINSGSECRLLLPFVDNNHNYYEKGVIDPNTIKGLTLTPYIPHEHELIHHPATDPTATLPGNIEYWECPVCGKYYADERALREITLADTVIAPLNAIKDGNVYAVGDTVIIPPGTKLFYFTSAHNQGAIKTFDSIVNLVVNQRESDNKEYLYAANMGSYLVNVSRSDAGYVFTGYFATMKEVVNIDGRDVETFAIEPIYAKESSVTNANWTWGTGEYDLPTASVTLNDFYWSDFGTPTKIELTQTITAAITTDITEAATCLHDGTKQDTAVALAYDGRFTATQERTYTGTHDMTHVEATPATCTENGNIEYWRCSECGKEFFDEDGDAEVTNSYDLVIEATGHDWDYEDGTWSWEGTADHPEVTFTYRCDNCGETQTMRSDDEIDELDLERTENVDPGCTTQGHRTYKAAYSYYSDEHTYDVPALGHGNLVHIAAAAPTCSNGVYTDGNIEYWRCERCGKLFSDEACGHEVTQAETVVPYFVFEYNADDGQFGVYGYNGADTVVTIPDTVPDNYPDAALRGQNVEYVHFTAFRDNTSITKVIMGDKMKHIGWEAFRRCTNLREVVIGNSLKKLDSDSFFECPSLEKMTCTTTDGNIEILNFLEQNTSITFCGYHHGAFHHLLKDRALLFVTITYIGIDAHTYDCEFLWKDGYDCYSASVYCKECDVSHAQTPAVTVTETAPTGYADGSKIYTATVSYEGHTFTDSKTEILPATGVSYLDENGEAQTAHGVRLITADTTVLDGGWYCADGTVNVNGSISVTGDSKIILMDGAKLTVTGALGLVNDTPYPITVYRQSGDHEGLLYVKSIAASAYTQAGGGVIVDDFVFASGDTTVYGGWFSITAATDPATPNNALYCEGNITIHGGYTDLTGVDCLKTPGTFTIDDGEIFLSAGSTAIQADQVVINGGHVCAETLDSNGIGIRSFSDVTINLTDPDPDRDRIFVSSFSTLAGVVIVNPLSDDDGNIYLPETLTDASSISNKFLQLAAIHEHELTHVAASGGNCLTKGNIEYWYCPTCNKYYTQFGMTEITQEQTLTGFGSHVSVHVDAVTPTYDPETKTYTNGCTEHWECSVCGKCFSDGNCGTEIEQADTVVPYFVYGTATNEVLIKRYNGADTEIVIPETIPDNYPDASLRGQTITTVGAYVFQNNTGITKLTTGDNLNVIGYRAFKGCSNLKEVFVGSGIRCFSAESFYDCNAITDFWCTKTDNSVGVPGSFTLFTSYTFNRRTGFTFHGSHSGAFYKEAHTQTHYNSYSTGTFSYLGTDAHTDDVRFEWLGCICTGAKAACANCDYTGESLSNITVTSAVTKDPGDDDGTRTYTASVEYNGVTYTDSVNEVIRCYFPVHSLTLGGDIGVNFYVRSAQLDADDSWVKFEWNGKTRIVPLGEAYQYGVDTLYKTTLYVSAAEMNDTITATLYCDDEQLAVHHFSVRDYCDYVLSADFAASYSDDRFDYNELVTLVKTMLNYGAMAQKQFDHNTDNLANHDINYDLTPLTADEIASIGSTLPKSADFDEVLAPYGVKYHACSLLLRSKTTLRFYFEKTGTGTYSADNFKIDGKTVEVKDYQDGSRYVYIEVTDIPSPELANAYTISVGDVIIGNVSPLSYAKDVLTDDTASEDLVNVITALYRYYEASYQLFN